MAKVRADVDHSKLLETALTEQVASYTLKVQGDAKEVQLAQGLNDEINRLRRQQATINSQIDALNMPSDSAGYLRIFSAARTPLEPNKSDSKKLLFVVLGAALFLGLGTTVAIDLADQRILDPSEVKRTVGFPPVGIVLDRDAWNIHFRGRTFAVSGFTQQLVRVQTWLTEHPEIAVLAVDYADALADPAGTTARLARFLGSPFDELKAAQAIEPSLRRQKSAKPAL